MDNKSFKKLMRSLKLPVDSVVSETPEEFTAFWEVKGGHGGARIVDRVTTALEDQGFILQQNRDSNSADGSKVSYGSTWAKENTRLTVCKFYGETKERNRFWVQLRAR